MWMGVWNGSREAHVQTESRGEPKLPWLPRYFSKLLGCDKSLDCLQDSQVTEVPRLRQR